MAAVRPLAAPLLAGLICAASLQCAAAPFAVQVGDTRLGLDAPPGFADTGFTGSPRLQEFSESVTSPSNRILLFAISDGDLRRFMAGDQIDARRYMLAVTPKGLERERVGAAVFSALVGDSLRELGDAPAAGADFRKHLDAKPGAPLLLAELRREPEIVSVLQGVRVPTPKPRLFEDEKPPQYFLTSTTLVLLRGKALNLQVFGPYENPADLDWIRDTTLRWIDELRRLNSR